MTATLSGMEVNVDGVSSGEQVERIENLRRDSDREAEFVAGYMALMSCTDRAARAVYMYASAR